MRVATVPAGFAEPCGFSIGSDDGLSRIIEESRETSARLALSVKAAPGVLKRVALWLDAWSMRSYGQDTHAWSAKMEVLRSLKASAQ